MIPGLAVGAAMTTWAFIGSGNIGSTEIGYDTVDLGPLLEGWRTQPDTAAYGVMYAVNPAAWDRGARPAPAAVVAERASVAQRRTA